jgi:uncharacterized membrane protein
MKFDPTWRQVALLAILLGAVIAAHIIAPGAISVVTSIVSTIVGALFVDIRRGGESGPPQLQSVPNDESDK